MSPAAPPRRHRHGALPPGRDPDAGGKLCLYPSPRFQGQACFTDAAGAQQGENGRVAHRRLRSLRSSSSRPIRGAGTEMSRQVAGPRQRWEPLRKPGAQARYKGSGAAGLSAAPRPPAPGAPRRPVDPTRDAPQNRSGLTAAPLRGGPGADAAGDVQRVAVIVRGIGDEDGGARVHPDPHLQGHSLPPGLCPKRALQRDRKAEGRLLVGEHDQKSIAQDFTTWPPAAAARSRTSSSCRCFNRRHTSVGKVRVSSVELSRSVKT